MIKFVTIAFSLILLKTCGNTKDLKSNLDTTTSNMVTTVDGGDFSVKSINDIDVSSLGVTLNFDESTKRVSGNSGCNNFSGEYSLEGESLTFSKVASTRKMCPDMTAENAINKVFSEINGYKIKNNQLTLFNDDLAVLIAEGINTSSSKVAQLKGDIIEYSLVTRGHFEKITIQDKSIHVQKGRDTKASIITCSEDNWNKLTKMIDDSNLDEFQNLTAPSKEHQVDGALIAHFSITKDGTKYSVPVFDGGNPNKELAPLINFINQLTAENKD